MEWLLIAFVLYMICGSMTARHTYAIKQREWLMIADSEEVRDNRMEEIQETLRTMKHGICNMNYSAMRERGCDCSKQKQWRNLHEELSALQEGGPVAQQPGPQWNTIMTWPAVAYHNFITPSVVKGEVERVTDEWEAGKVEAKPLEGYTVDELAKLMINPWEHFTREDDVLAKQIKNKWSDIKALADAELAEAKTDDDHAFVQSYEDKYTVFNGDGTVRKTFLFDEEPILIGLGADPKANQTFTSTMTA